MAQYRRATISTPSGNIGRFLQSFADSQVKQQELQLMRQKALGEKAPSMAERLLIATLSGQNPMATDIALGVGINQPDPTQVAGAASAMPSPSMGGGYGQASMQLLPSRTQQAGVQDRDAQIKSLQQQAMDLGVDPIAFNTLFANIGGKIPEGQKAALDIAKDVTKQEALAPGELQKKEQELALGVQSQVAQEEATRVGKIQTEVEKLRSKTGAETDENTLRLLSSSNVLGDVFLKRSADLFDRYNIRPGLFQGLLESLPGEELSQFKASFEGAGIENAAQTAAISIPSSRAIKIVSVFSKSGPGKWSTIESGVNNMASTWQQTISKDVLANPEEYGLKRATGKDKSKSVSEANKIALDSANLFRDNFLKNVYRSNPGLFSDNKEKKRIAELIKKEDTVSRVDIGNQVLAEMGY